MFETRYCPACLQPVSIPVSLTTASPQLNDHCKKCGAYLDPQEMEAENATPKKKKSQAAFQKVRD
jgi:methionyl-tRNA synthetase